MALIYGREILVENLQKATGHLKKGIKGELEVLNYLEQIMPIDATIIAKPAIGNSEPDFIVILPKEAFFIIEVKNIALQGIEDVLSNGVLKMKNGNINNPLTQVNNHVDQLNQFVVSNYGNDVFKSIGKIVVFPDIIKKEFETNFDKKLSTWNEDQLNKFYRYYTFSDELKNNFLIKLKKSRKFSSAQINLSRTLISEMAILIKPRPNTESSIEVLNGKKLLDEKFFNNELIRLIQKDKENGKAIKKSINDLLYKELPYLKGAKTYEQAYLALRNLKVAIKAESSTYLNYINELTYVENKMLNQRTRIVEQFKEDVQKGLHTYFEKRLQIMKLEIKLNTNWNTSFSDTSKKVAGPVYNNLLKLAKKSSSIQAKVSNIEELDERSEMEKILEEYLEPKKVGVAYNQVMKTAIKRYEKNWEKVISEFTPNLRGLKTFSPSSVKVLNQNLKHQLGASEQVLGLTIASAVIGTIGLAAGWHTLTYAVLNVFPPIAVFAAIATIATAVLRKDNEVQKKQAQLEEAVSSYKQHLFQQIDPPRITSDNNSLFRHIEKASDGIVHTTINEWEKQLFGKFETEDYQELFNLLSAYAELIDESIIDINNYMEQEQQIEETGEDNLSKNHATTI